MSSEITPANIWAYITGKLRYKLYYSGLKSLIRPHIREQIAYRIGLMRENCYWQGQCEVCGCQTTALQMAAKSCEGSCYPEMISKDRWENFKKGKSTLIAGSWYQVASNYSLVKVNNQDPPKIYPYVARECEKPW